MKSPVKPKLMRILLDGNPHREIDLATGVGFTKTATIRKLIDSFERARFIVRRREGESGWTCQLNLSRDAVLKIYGYPEFVLLRPEIRGQNWFCPLFTGNYTLLPGPLPEMLRRMIVQSHTFFETISRYDTPEKLRETFGPVLLLNRLAGVEDPLFNDRYLLYQIFVHAVIRDIEHGGLGNGFAQLLDECQESLKEQFRETGTVRRPNRRSHCPAGKGDGEQG